MIITIPNQEPQETSMCLPSIGTTNNMMVNVAEYLELVRKEIHAAIELNLFFLYCIDDNGELNELSQHFPQLVENYF